MHPICLQRNPLIACANPLDLDEERDLVLLAEHEAARIASDASRSWREQSTFQMRMITEDPYLFCGSCRSSPRLGTARRKRESI